MKPGKPSAKLLADLLSRLPSGDPRVLVGPRVGEDAAVIDFGEPPAGQRAGRLLVAKTDPITFATDLIGWYAVHVNANDIATMGASPRWFMGSLLLPESAQEATAAAIFDQIAQACQGLGITAVGGHTEVTIGLDRPILVGAMLGEVERDQLITSGGARPGDVLILAGSIAIEGTALLAREAGDDLIGKGLSPEAVAEARNLLFTPGISVVPAARAAIAAGGVTALHDPTEGGLATGLRELAIASGVGLEVEAEAIRGPRPGPWATGLILPLTQQICSALQLDPLGLIASGALLIAARPGSSGSAEATQGGAEAVLASLRGCGVEAGAIGRVLPAEQGLWLITDRGRERLPEFERDEVARFLERRG